MNDEMSKDSESEEQNESTADNLKKDGVHLSEEFQQEAHELISGATEKEISYIQQCCSDRSSELRDEKKPKGMKGKPEVYDEGTM
jgi:hypothetical protein